MTQAALAGHPFGTVITEETLKQIFAPLTQWEDKYRQLILLGKQLPTLSDDLKAQAKEIAGCENRVWLGFSVSGEKLHFFGDSEGRIVRGLLAVLLTAVEGKSAAELLAHSPLMFFDELELRAAQRLTRSGSDRAQRRGTGRSTSGSGLTFRLRHHLFQGVRNRHKAKGSGYHGGRPKP